MTNPLHTLEAPASDSDNQESRSKQSAWEAPYVVFFLMLFMATLLFLPWILHGGDVLKSQKLGRLQAVHYVGGIRTDTQIEVSTAEQAESSTQWQSYLLRGVASLPAQSELELREGAASTQICIQQTDQCWALRGN